MSNRIVATVAHKPASTLGLVAIFISFGLGLVLQPNRWSATPAYGNLLLIMSSTPWGICYAVIGLGLLVSVFINTHRERWLYIATHAVAFMLLVSWEAAFVVRWLTDPKTTIANVVAWAVYLALVARSATLLDA